MNGERVLVIGATGLVGSEIIRGLIDSRGVREIHTLTRRPLSAEMRNAKIHEFVANFDQVDGGLACFSVDTVFCAIGTTIKKAGSQAEFRKIDYEYPLKIARFAKASGAKRFLLVSALGANTDSRFFYNRVKGELERDLEKIGFASLIIARPSLLLGERSEFRFAEHLGQQVGRFFPRRWRGIPAKSVAGALIKAWDQNETGMKIIENAELLSSPR